MGPLSKRISYIFTALSIQLFVGLCAWPLFLLWGLPIAWLSPLGNMLFTPFLTLFLLISTGLFCTLLCGLQASFWGTLLDSLVYVWQLILEAFPIDTLLYCPCPPYLVLGLIPISAWCIFRFLRRSAFVRFSALFGLCVFWFTLCAYVPWGSRSITLSCGSKQVILCVDKNERHLVIDPDGVCGRRSCSVRWKKGVLRPALARMFGKAHATQVVIGRMPQSIVLCIDFLKMVHASHVYLKIDATGFKKEQLSCLVEALSVNNMAVTTLDDALDAHATL